jgi:hypothetical protein
LERAPRGEKLPKDCLTAMMGLQISVSSYQYVFERANISLRARVVNHDIMTVVAGEIGLAPMTKF